MRTFSGKFDQDGLYGWMNPDMPREARYASARLLGDYVETDASAYDYFLEMMPPVNFTHNGFAICEAATDDIRLAFFRVDGRFFAAHISDTDPANKMAAVRQAIADAVATFNTTPAKIAMEYQDEVRDLTAQGIAAAQTVRCLECGEPVPTIFEHIDQDCTAGRKLEPVDLGYCFFCAFRRVECDPFGWLQADKEPWIKMAQEFIRMAGLKQ